MTLDSRVLELAGVHNFRDYGGYASAAGGRLRRGILWRSGQHADASEHDLARIAALGLATIFDLRFAAERSSHPCRRAPGFAPEILFIDENPAAAAQEVKAAPHVAVAQAAFGRDPAEMRAMMMRTYATIAFRPALVGAMRRYLQALAQDGRPSLIHCMAGKDRTGIAVAMLHRAVGVHRDDVMADFLATNTAGDAAARIAAGARVVQEQTGVLDTAAVQVLMGVEPQYLDSAFAAVIDRHGSEDRYLDEVLGADSRTRERLRVRLLE